jgi:DNA (cytosine-5)-methyltransferase 1
MASIDLYSGIGGWTLGLRMSGEEVLNSYEWWDEANRTHNLNHGFNHPEIDIRGLVDKNGVIRPDLLPEPGTIDFVVGSPPCTQFSYANRGGGGDITEGLIDINSFLRIVEYLRPRCWAMENVPRVSNILKNEVFGVKGSLKTFKGLFNDDPSNIQVYDASEFGVPQRRKRMIAGNFNHTLLNSYKKLTTKLTLYDVISSLRSEKVKDIIYGVVLDKKYVTDNIEEEILSYEEERINRESKQFHPVYNKMSFPEKTNVPSRTVTALCTRVSRESIILKVENGYRRLTVRERSCLQSFPITYQFYGNSYGSKLKMIGNAIPPLLAYHVINAMKGIKKPKPPHDLNYIHTIPKELPKIFQPPVNGQHFKKDRRFHSAIPNLRFGSGVRFDIMNYVDFSTKEIRWEMGFYYGTSKKIKDITLNNDLSKRVIDHLSKNGIDLKDLVKDFQKRLKSIDFPSIQLNWIHKVNNGIGPFELCDLIGEYSKKILERIDGCDKIIEGFDMDFLNDESRKINGIKNYLLSGFILGGIFNHFANKIFRTCI